MRFRDLIADTLRTLWAHKMRAGLTMFGIAWGIVSITLMVAAGEGLEVGQQMVADQFGKDVMLFFAGRTTLQTGGTRAGRQIRFHAEDYAFIRQEATDCAVVVPELGSRQPIRSLYNNAALLVVSSLPPFADIRSIPVAEGRFYSWDDDAAARRVAFIGSDARKQLFAGRSALGQTIIIRDLPFVIIGVMKEKDQDSSYDGRDINKIYIPVHTMLRDFPEKPPHNPDEIDRLIATPTNLSRHESCKAQVRRALARVYGFDPADTDAAFCWDTIEASKSFAKMTEGMKYFLGAVGIVTLFLGGIGVMNVMLVAVRERTREIGIRKAVGATALSILHQFFAEALIIVFLSGALGMGAAFGICSLVDMLPMPQYFAGLLPTWGSALLSFSLLSAVAVLSALYPARRAAAVDPIEALRFEAGG